MSDTKEKLEDDFIEFWDTHAEKLGLGKYSSEIARFWLDKLDLVIAEYKELLLEVKLYIEESEEMFDKEYCSGRDHKQIFADGDMPPLYNKIINNIK